MTYAKLIHLVHTGKPIYLNGTRVRIKRITTPEGKHDTGEVVFKTELSTYYMSLNLALVLLSAKRSFMDMVCAFYLSLSNKFEGNKID